MPCRSMEKNNSNRSAKKYLSTQKQLRVWIKPEKYELFKEKANEKGASIYAVINDFIDSYIK